MATPKKALHIQPFRQASHMDQTAAKAVWESLSKAIDEIYNQNASQLSFEELYRFSYNLVMQKHGDVLYDGLRANLSAHLARSAAVLNDASNDQLLDHTAAAWAAHTIAFNMIKDILMYMDRSYCPQKKRPLVLDLAQALFRDIVVYSAGGALLGRLRVVLLEQIALERAGCMVDRGLLRAVLGMLLSLSTSSSSGSVYEAEFLPHFLSETEHFYKAESLALLSANPAPLYVRRAEARLSEEAERVKHYLGGAAEAKLRVVLDDALIAAHAPALLDMDSGYTAMLRAHRLEDLVRIAALFLRVPACYDLLREGMGRFIAAEGAHLLGSEEVQQVVQRILDLKAKFDAIISQAFRGDKRFLKTLKDSFEAFINRDHRCAAQLASYLDERLRGAQAEAEAEAEKQLDAALTIFRYLADKDVFENFYRKLLSRRLLGNKSASEEVERSMISRLKAECGYQFTSKLEGMLLDMKMSKAADYRPATSSLELEVVLLTTGYWPLPASPPQCRLPAPITAAMTAFRVLYAERNSGRKLSWLHSVGGVDLRAAFPSGRHELSVSLYQCALLLLFNEQAAWSLEDLLAATEIPAAELKQHLLSLCTPKLRILVKASKGRGIEAGDSFAFNADFSSKFKRIKVPLIALKEVQGGAGAEAEGAEGCGDGVPQQVEEERRHQVEAAIVRIMKARKTLGHHELVAEVTRQLSFRFTPTPQFIKKRIESLIEREYLQRHADDARLYNYLA